MTKSDLLSSMATRLKWMVVLPVVFVIGAMFGMQLALLRLTPALAWSAVVTILVVYLMLEVLLFVCANLLSLFMWSADQWVAFYNAWKPLRPTHAQEYWQKKLMRQQKREAREGGANGD